MSNNLHDLEPAYLSTEWRQNIGIKYGQFAKHKAKALRKPTKVIDISEWLKIHNLEVLLSRKNLRLRQGEMVDPQTKKAMSRLILASAYSGGSYRILDTEIYHDEKQDDKTLSSSLRHIKRGFENLCSFLNSHETEYLQWFYYQSYDNPIWGKSIEPFNHVRSSKYWPNIERWTTQITFSPNKSKELITACIKAMVKNRTYLDVAGMSKYISSDTLISTSTFQEPHTQFIGLTHEYCNIASKDIELETEIKLG